MHEVAFDTVVLRIHAGVIPEKPTATSRSSSC
jgi:hypothetical protein